MSPSADSPFKRCARTSAPAMVPKSPTLLPPLRVSPPPHPLPLSTAMTPARTTPCTLAMGSPHGPHIPITPSVVSTIIATQIRTAHPPSSLPRSCIKTNNTKTPPRVSRPPHPAIYRAASHSFVAVANYSPLKVTSSSPYSSPSYTIYPPLLSPLPSQHPGFVTPGLVSGASMFY